MKDNTLKYLNITFSNKLQIIYLMIDTIAAGLLNSVSLIPKSALCHDTQPLTPMSDYGNLFP